MIQCFGGGGIPRAIRMIFETVIRSSPSLEFGEVIDPSQLSKAEAFWGRWEWRWKNLNDCDWPPLFDLPTLCCCSWIPPIPLAKCGAAVWYSRSHLFGCHA